MRRLLLKALAAATLLLTVSACATSNRTLLPPTNVASSQARNDVASAARKGYGIIRFRIAVPGRTRNSRPHRVVPAYVSSATQKVAVTVRGADQSASIEKTFPCTAVCVGKIVAPLGVDVVTLRLEDKKSRVLSRGTTTVVVFKQGTAFDFTLDGVPVTAEVTPQSNLLPVVPASAGYVTFEARDADGRIITADGHYVDEKGNPLVFDIASSNKSFQLSVTTVSAPGAPIAYSYQGNQHVGKFTLTPSAHKGVKTSVAFKKTAVKLVPGIARRITPPIPVQLLSATQVPVPAGQTGCSGSRCFDGNAIFLLGNTGDLSTTLKFDVTDGAYGEARTAGTLGPFSSTPIVYAIGFDGVMYQNGLWAEEQDDGNSLSLDSGSSTNPCSGFVPIGHGSAGTLFCATGGLSQAGIYDMTHATPVAQGQDRKIQEINGTTYFATVVQATPGPTQEVYASGSLTPVTGAISVGADAANPATAYYGDFDGSVKRGTTTVATFSNAVENVLGNGNSIYVFERSGVFGVSRPSGTFESVRLPIGTVLELVSGPKGAPMLVETNGVLDVIGI